jgi:hypothetical protein
LNKVETIALKQFPSLKNLTGNNPLYFQPCLHQHHAVFLIE